MVGRIQASAVAVMVCGLLSFAAGKVEAQVPLGAAIPVNLNIKGSGTVSNGDNGGDPVDKFSTRTVSLGTRDILNLISQSSGITYPSSVKVILDPSTDDVLVEDSMGNLIEDLTADGYVTVSLGTGVWSGQTNSVTSAQNFSGSYFVTVSVDDQAGDTIVVSGLTKETYSVSAPNKKGIQTASDSFTMTLVGEGSLFGNEATASITVTGSGKASIGGP